MFAERPRICIIIAAFNTAKYIRATLESAFCQTYDNYEVIVVNDDSPDTPMLEHELEPFLHMLTYLKHETNRGLSAARNTALRHTAAPLFMLLDSDDILLPDSLEIHFQHLTRHPDAAVVYGDGRFFGNSLEGRLFSSLYPSVGDVTVESLVTRKCTVFIAALAVKAAVESVGLFDEELRSCEDFELWCRLLVAGHRIYYHQSVVLLYRRRAGSLSQDEVGMHRWMAKACEKVLIGGGPLTETERLVIRRRMAEEWAWISLARGKEAFVRQDFATARTQIWEANSVLKRRRLLAISAMLLICPTVALWLYRPRA